MHRVEGHGLRSDIGMLRRPTDGMWEAVCDCGFRPVGPRQVDVRELHDLHKQQVLDERLRVWYGRRSSRAS